MDYINDDSLLYLGLILALLVFFLWSRGFARKKKNSIKGRNFRRRYEERKKERQEK